MNRFHIKRIAGAALTVAGAITFAAWRAGAQMEVYTDPADGGPDFPIQGEYRGSAGGDETWGAQVIARGDGAFEAALTRGGLPGDGWDKSSRIRLQGRRENGTVTFGKAGGWNGTIADGTFRGQTDQGAAFEMRKVTRESSTAGRKAPEGALTLFDGSSADAWTGGKITADGLLQPGPRTKQKFEDFTLHLEFRTPLKPKARGQQRGNSGVYLNERYEIQVLDSFGLEEKNNECGAVYQVKAPDVNMTYPPLSWQTYDIDFQVARFDESGKKAKSARVTVRHNGVVVQNDVEMQGPTGGARRRNPERADAVPGSLSFQNHGNPVHFRNVWLREGGKQVKGDG